MFTIRQRISSNEPRSMHLIKLERGSAQRSLLHYLEKGCFSLIHYLLQTRTNDARERDNEGRTALIYCCFIDNDCWAQNLAIILLEYGAKVADQDQRGLNALHYAIIKQRPILVRRYLASLDFNLKQTADIHGNTCLHYACSTGNIEILRMILNAMKRYSIDLTITNRYDLTAYDIACQLNNERSQNLLRNEMTGNERNKRPFTSPVKTNSLPRTLGHSINRHVLTPSVTHCTGSGDIAPLSVSSTKNARKHYPSASSFHSDSASSLSPILIDPLESRNITLKRNESLDLSLLNQVKSLSNLQLSSSLSSSSQSDISSSSQLTWRDDFLKLFDRFQTLKTPSYRETVHPPLNKELPPELYQSLYGTENRNDTVDYLPSFGVGSDLSQKVSNRRRSSVLATRAFNKWKK